jgi:hypothetical protein
VIGGSTVPFTGGVLAARFRSQTIKDISPIAAIGKQIALIMPPLNESRILPFENNIPFYLKSQP